MRFLLITDISEDLLIFFAIVGKLLKHKKFFELKHKLKN